MVFPVCMPTKQLQELNETASMRPEVKKHVMTTLPIQARSNSWFVYLVTDEVGLLSSIASISFRVGDGVGVRSATFFRDGLGLGCREGIGVLFNVGAAELYFSSSGLVFAPSGRNRSKSANVTAKVAGAGDDDIPSSDKIVGRHK